MQDTKNAQKFLPFDFENVLDTAASEDELGCIPKSVDFKQYNDIRQLFADEEFRQYMQCLWPIFCRNVDSLYIQCGRMMQEVGKMREMAIIYLFDRYLGECHSYKPMEYESISANEKGKDWSMFGRSVSCKTVSCKNGCGNLKISWVEDKVMAQEVESKWQPEHDLLLCRIKWGSDSEGFYYISKEVQIESLDLIGRQNAFQTANGYSKGTSLRRAMINAMITHPDCLKLAIKMPEENRDFNSREKMFDGWYDSGLYDTLL